MINVLNIVTKSIGYDFEDLLSIFLSIFSWCPISSGERLSLSFRHFSNLFQLPIKKLFLPLIEKHFADSAKSVGTWILRVDCLS